MELKYEDGQTPIDEDEKRGLKIKSISTMRVLDEFEQQNIEDAMQWAHRRSFESSQVLRQNCTQKKSYKLSFITP